MKMIVNMKRWRLLGLLCLLLAATIVLPQRAGVRAWSGNPAQNTAICTYSGDQTHPQLISDGSGGAIITWGDYRSGNSDIYAQKVDSGGSGKWTAGGVAICTATGGQWVPQLISDGLGGGIIAWNDYRSGNYDIYAQRVDSGGNVKWAANGVAICTASGGQTSLQLISDGTGGAIITWNDYRSGNYDIYAQSVDSGGNVMWTTNGVAICTTPEDQHSGAGGLISDGSGGAIITWYDYRSGAPDIYAQRVDSGGAVKWTPNGVAICTASGVQDLPRLVSDGSGGAIITWDDYRGDTGYDIYAQRVDSGGITKWTANGVAICTASHGQSDAQIISDGSGGAIIIWQDYRSGTNSDVYAQRVDSSGNVQWSPANGVAICTASGNQYNPRITFDGSGGAIITWEDARDGINYDIYAQRVDSGGSVKWATSGVAICTAPGEQNYPQLTSDGTGGVIITWQDYRSGTNNYDIYAQRLYSSGSLSPGSMLWSGDSAQNTAVCTASGTQYRPQIISDGSGGAIITWHDRRSGNSDIYARRVDSSGAVLWTANGVAICTSPGDQEYPQIVSDGSGGAIITWADYRSGTNWDVFAQRVDSGGAVKWPANGVPISTAPGSQYNPQIASDGSGGAIITWQDYRDGSWDIYAQRVDSAGNAKWYANGVGVETYAQDQENPRIISDGSGGAIITWQDYWNGTNYDIYAKKVSSTGVVQWGGGGAAVCTASGDQYGPQLASDGSGGAIITWEDRRSGTNYDIYAQRVDSGGAVKWTANGVAITTDSYNQEYPRIISDGSGGAIITWQDYYGGNWDIYAQKVDSAGAVKWTPGGKSVCFTSGDQSYPQLVSDGSGGAIVTWQDYRGSNVDIYAQRVDSGGNVKWTANGVPISTASGNQSYPELVSDGSGGAIITWEDYRSATDFNFDIYAHRVGSTGSLPDTTPPTVALSSTATSPTNTSPVPMTATFSEAVSGFTLGDIVVGNGTAGSFAGSGSVYTFSVTPAGQGTVTVNVPAGVAQDAGGNGNTAAPQFSIVYDSIAPAVTLTSTATSPANTSPIPMTATFSEAVTGFALEDIVVGNGSAGSFSPVSSSVYNFDVTPAGQGLVTVDLPAGAAQDAAGNGNVAAAQFSITYDGLSPTVTLTSMATSPTNTSPIPMTATFSEAVSGFALEDIVVGNGTAGSFTPVSASVYTFVVTPAGQGTVTVDVPAGVAQDAASHGNAAAAQFSITFDSVSPAVALTSTAASPTNTSPIPMTATFSEAVSGFALEDIVVGNGSASAFVAISPTAYTFNVTPAGQGMVTVDVAAGAARDEALNGNSAAVQFSIVYDNISPTLTLTSTATTLTNTSPIPMTATFSEAVSGFALEDIAVGNGTAGSFNAVSPTVYSFAVTPAGEGLVTVDVPAGAAQDAAGNGNTAPPQFSITYDPLAPTVTLSSTATSPTGISPIPMTATFSEAVTGFALEDITVGNGTASNFVAVSTTVYTFSVTPAGQGLVTVDVAAGAAQNATLRGNAGATQFSITFDSVSPTLTLTSTATSPTDTWPIPMTATFSEAVTGFALEDIAVGNGSASEFVAVSPTVYTFNVTPAGQGVITVDVPAGSAQDAAGNGNTAAARFSITYDGPSILPPTITSFGISSATDEGHVVIITGTNFSGATAVKFGGTDALSFTVDSATQITALVGPDAGGKIAVTTPGGTGTSDEDFDPSASAGGSSNWWLIAPILGGVIVLGAIGYWLLASRRRARA